MTGSPLSTALASEMVAALGQEHDAKDNSEDELLKALAQIFLVNNLDLGGVEMSFMPCIVLRNIRPTLSLGDVVSALQPAMLMPTST